MSARPVTVAFGLLAGGLLVVSTAAPALAVCDAYSNGCLEQPAVLDTVLDRPAGGEDGTQGSTAGGSAPTRARTGVAETGATPATLPFTGGELVLVSTLGAAAVAGGVGLVAAGRRRRREA